LNIPQQVNVTHLSLTIFNIGQDLFHPPGSLSARRTLATAFVAVEAGQRHGMTHHSLVFIQHNKAA
jgi:hypothetical protein